MKKVDITRDVLRLKRREIAADGVVQACLLFVYSTMRRYFPGNDDLWHDYLCDCLPRIKRAIDGFEYDGREFFPYLHRCMQFHMRDYLKSHRIKELRRSQLAGYTQTMENPEDLCCDETPVQRDIEDRIDSSLQSSHEPKPQQAKDFFELSPDSRRMTLLILRLSTWLNDPTIDRFAEITGLSPEWLHEKVDLIRAELAEDRARYAKLSDRSSELHFLRYQLQCEECIHASLGLSEEYRKYSRKASMEVVTGRLSRLQRRMAGVRLFPSNKFLATVLGIPKGSVDSGIYYLRRNPERVLPLVRKLFNRDRFTE